MPVDQVFPLEGFQSAIARVQEPGRNGKVLLAV